MKNIQPLHLILGGCGLAILGCFLPWASVSIDSPLMKMSNSPSGINSNRGVFTLLLAVAAIVIHFVKVPGKDKLMALIATICAGLAALIGLYSMFDIKGDSSNDINDILGTGAISISIGIGLYLVVLGGLAGAFGWFQRFQKIPGPIVPPAGPLPPPPPPGPPPAP